MSCGNGALHHEKIIFSFTLGDALEDRQSWLACGAHDGEMEAQCQGFSWDNLVQKKVFHAWVIGVEEGDGAASAARRLKPHHP